MRSPAPLDVELPDDLPPVDDRSAGALLDLLLVLDDLDDEPDDAEAGR